MALKQTNKNRKKNISWVPLKKLAPKETEQTVKEVLLLKK